MLAKELRLIVLMNQKWLALPYRVQLVVRSELLSSSVIGSVLTGLLVVGSCWPSVAGIGRLRIGTGQIGQREEESS